MGNAITGPSYEEIYKNANYIHRSVATPVCSEVMSVSRMYMAISELDPKRLKNSEIVKELYVFADVLFLDDISFTWPGLEVMFGLIRVVVYNVPWTQAADGAGAAASASVTIRAPWLNVPSTTFIIGHQEHIMSPISCCIRAKQNTARAGTAPAAFFLQAQQVVNTSDTAKPAVSDFVLKLQARDESSTHDMWEINPENIFNWADVNLTILWAMEATVLVAELILTYMSTSTRTVEEATLHLKWVNQLLIQALQTKDGASNEAVERLFDTLLLQVQLLLNKPSLVTGIVVPRLQYSTYRNLITTMAHMADGYTKEFQQLIMFLEQNEVLGAFLLEQNQAFAAKERDMESFHSELHKVKTNDLIQALATLEQLEVHMTEMNAEMEQAQQDMEEGLRRFRNRQVARAVFSVFRSIVAIASAFFTGGATAGAAVSSTRNAVDQVVEMKSSLERIVETLEKLLLVSDFLVAMKELINAVQNVHEAGANVPALPDMPTEAEWTIFENEIEAVAAEMPEEVSEVLTWKTKCKNMAAIGREMVTMATVISQLQYDVRMHDLLQEVSRNQAERLEAIKPVDVRNYQEMATQLEMRTTQILLGLLEVLSLQNAAIQYQYLIPPSPVIMNNTIITMSDVWTELLQQEAAAVVALTELGFPTDRKVTYMVKGIPVGVLLDGQDWDFSISTEDVDHFPYGWSRVRISYVEMKFVSARLGSTAPAKNEEIHEPITDTGEVYMVLRGEQTFADRKRGEKVKYEAVAPVKYQYAYKLETGEMTEQNRPTEEFANHFMRMTPFTRWKLRMSGSARENQGLAFPTATAMDATTQIVIHFYVTAIRAVDWHTKSLLKSDSLHY